MLINLILTIQHDPPPRSMIAYRLQIALISLWLMSGSQIHAADGAMTGVMFFEKKIRPVLVEHCYKCHSSKADLLKAEFLLDTRIGIRKGGVSGRDAVIPGDVTGSHLIEAIRYGNEELQMPPDGKLPASVITDFEAWIAMGAPDPRDGVSRKPVELVAENHWAWKVPQRHEAPEIKNSDWPRDKIDHFILAGLEAKGLSPSEDADRRTLIRRVTLELTGLPPTPEAIKDFLADKQPEDKALAKVVDRLLTSSAFGERWARHWLDVARFGESSGYSRNMLYPYAWRYRNWVIDSLNADKPYDQFVKEQIAGDLLPSKSQVQHEDQLLGTAFLTIGAKTFNEGNLLLFNLNAADDQIDATCRAFLGITANCARCHDHKYDPVSTKDYYALAGIFLSSQHLAGSVTNVRLEHGDAYPLGKDGWGQLKRIELAKKKADKAQSDYLALIKIRDDFRKPLIEKKIDWKKNPTPELKAAEDKVQKFQAVVKAAKESIPKPPSFAMAVVEAMNAVEAAEHAKACEAQKAVIAEAKKNGKKPPLPTPAKSVIADSPVYDKGLHDAPLDKVPRGALSYFGYQTDAIGKTESGRRQLADWIVDKRNPLTARVYVNRIWHHLFGRGLVATVDNFGALGLAPSHQELLDDLAMDFVADGWSTKKLIRRLVLSRTYSQSSKYRDDYAKKDPDNELLWRFAPQSLEGEAIRDSILVISGRLDAAQLQTSQVAEISKQKDDGRQREIGRRDYYKQDVTWDVLHRSIYLPMARGVIPDMLATFDAADPNLVVGARKLTIVPTQALYMMNSSFVLEESKHVARRIIDLPEEQRVTAAYEFMFARLPFDDERKFVAKFFQQKTPDESERTWARICQTLFCSAEFRTLY